MYIRKGRLPDAAGGITGMRTEDQWATMSFRLLDNDVKKRKSNSFSLFGLDNTELCIAQELSGRPSPE